MKRILCLAVAIIAVVTSFAKTDPIGMWQGSLSAGREIRLVFHIKEENKKLSATMDSPDQGVKDIPCSDVTVNGDSIIISLEKFKSRYAGVIASNTISGRWEQNGMSFTLNLTQVTKVDEPLRPQTPKPPF